MKHYTAALGAALAFAAGIGTPAHAVTFNLIDIGGAQKGTLARRGFDIAASYWSSVLTDDVTVNLQIGFGPLGEGILGSTGSSYAGVLVQDTYARLGLDARSVLDARAVANLAALGPSSLDPAIQSVSAYVNGYTDDATKSGIDTTTVRYDDDGSWNNSELDVTTANLKALGFTTDDQGEDITGFVDGQVVFSSDFNFDFDPTDGYDFDSYDFIGTAVHEIGHALGFVSGVDTYDIFGRPDSPTTDDPDYPEGYTYADLLESGDLGSSSIDDFRVASVLDLYRYNADGTLDWTVKSPSFFSIDGGASQLFGGSKFSTGTFNGDGNQASHWIDNTSTPGGIGCTIINTPGIGIMDPTAGRCETGHVTALDLAAFDAIGWDVNVDVLKNPGYSASTLDLFREFSGVPEPVTWLQMVVGFGTLGAALRRRRERGMAFSA